MSPYLQRCQQFFTSVGSGPHPLLPFSFIMNSEYSMADFQFQKLAIPAVCILISFLAYSSQVLFLYLEPRPLSLQEISRFNILVLCIWICYYKACYTDPGNTYQYLDGDGQEIGKTKGGQEEDESESERNGTTTRNRWCRKCDRSKPPRAHHCKSCGRSVTQDQ